MVELGLDGEMVKSTSARARTCSSLGRRWPPRGRLRPPTPRRRRRRNEPGCTGPKTTFPSDRASRIATRQRAKTAVCSLDEESVTDNDGLCPSHCHPGTRANSGARGAVSIELLTRRSAQTTAGSRTSSTSWKIPGRRCHRCRPATPPATAAAHLACRRKTEQLWFEGNRRGYAGYMVTILLSCVRRLVVVQFFFLRKVVVQF
jgi:hypothetical protein